MSTRRVAFVVVAVLVAAAGCSSTETQMDSEARSPALGAAPSAHCASDGGLYDGFRSYLAQEAADEPWIDRVAVCAGGLLEVDQAGMGDAAARDEALEVCEAAAGYLITNPPPPERADAPNPKEIGIIVADADGSPLVLGAEDEAGSAGRDGAEAEREAEREREEAATGADGEGRAREPEPFRCFAPFA